MLFYFVRHFQFSLLATQNEQVYSRGITGNLDWIEIYNPADVQIDITGFKIYDSGGKAGTKPKKLFQSGAVLPAKGFYVIITDTIDFVGDQSDFGISNGGETVWLEDAVGLLIDSVVIPALGLDTSYARIPDGSNTFAKSSPTTKGASNDPVIPVELTSFIASSVSGNVNLE